MFIPSVTASNPYQDFAQVNGLDYGDVLNYVDVLDGVKEINWTYWHDKACKLSHDVKVEISRFRSKLREHYGI